MTVTISPNQYVLFVMWLLFLQSKGVFSSLLKYGFALWLALTNRMGQEWSAEVLQLLFSSSWNAAVIWRVQALLLKKKWKGEELRCLSWQPAPKPQSYVWGHLGSFRSIQAAPLNTMLSRDKPSLLNSAPRRYRPKKWKNRMIINYSKFNKGNKQDGKKKNNIGDLL